MKSGINPFDSQEAKPYKNDNEIVAMTNLVTAYQVHICFKLCYHCVTCQISMRYDNIYPLKFAHPQNNDINEFEKILKVYREHKNIRTN